MADDGGSSLLAVLTNKGIRLTRQRRIVLRVIENATAHLSAKDLLKSAREEDDRIDRATVYRTLAILKEAGVIDELDLMHMEGEQHYYERRRSAHHVHICCQACGRVDEMETDLIASLMSEIRRKAGFEPETIRIEVRARCPECRQLP